MRFLKSFKYAFRGIIYCINNERNMRIHTVIALYVFAFSLFFHLSRVEYAVLCLTVALVFMAELFNTVAEEFSDLTAASFNPVVRIVKDMASGGVLVGAGFSVLVGVCLFWRPAVFARILRYFSARPALWVLFPAVTAAAVFYIALGPLGIRDWGKRKRNRNLELEAGENPMEYTILGQGKNIAHVSAAEKIVDAQSALDLIMSAQYETNCSRLILDKTCFADNFFILSSGLAGEVLQKFVNYRVKVAIVGDYSNYASKPLKDFICESNRGNDVFFVSTMEEAVKKLERAK